MPTAAHCNRHCLQGCIRSGFGFGGFRSDFQVPGFRSPPSTVEWTMTGLGETLRIWRMCCPHDMSLISARISLCCSRRPSKHTFARDARVLMLNRTLSTRDGLASTWRPHLDQSALASAVLPRHEVDPEAVESRLDFLNSVCEGSVWLCPKSG